MKKQDNMKKWLYWFTLGIAIIIVYKLFDNFTAIGEFLKNLLGIFMPFIIGILIAYILYIPCKKIEGLINKCKFKFIKKKSRGIAIFTVYLIVLLLLIILINCILPPVINSVNDLISNLPNYYKGLTKTINELPNDSIFVRLNAKELINKISSIDFIQYITPEYIYQYIRGAVSVARGLFDVFVTFIISIYTLTERDRILKFLKKLSIAMFGNKKYNKLSKYFTKSNEVFFGFISGQLIDAVLVGVATSIAMSILNVKYAVLLGFLIGLFNLIPFFGAIVAVGFAILITFCTGGLSKTIWLAIIVIIIQQIDANIINPKIMSDRLKISPILVILSVTVAGSCFGVLGMFLAVPVVTILKLMIDDYINVKIK